jgi:hypothetical protein
MFRQKGVACAWFVAVSILLILAPSAYTQTSSTGAIKGTITDSSGAAIPNVTVTSMSLDTGQSRTAKTGDDGSYVIPLLPLGNYKLKLEASGFNTEQVPSVTVNVSETTVFNRALTVGSQTQEVTVAAEAEALQTSNATLGDVISSTSTAALPLTTRNYTNLLGLSSGANSSVFNASTLGKGTTDIAVNGNSTKQNNVSMDGVSIQQHDAQGVLAGNGQNPDVGLVSPDAIQEFKIQTTMFDATFGRNPGANVNVVTKSGTNQFHGTAFEFFRNTVLNSNDFFRSQSGPVNGVPNNSRQVLNQNQFGGVFGGPIKKDKLFFFTSYQETRQINGASPAGYSATNLLPIPGGDRSNTALFQSALGAEFCPGGPDGGNASYPAGNLLGTPATPGVQVLCSGANINPVALKILQLKNPDGTYYIPSGPSTITGNGVTTSVLATTISIPARFTEHQILQNVDYVISAKNTLSAHYYFGQDPTTIPFQCGAGASVPGNCYPNTGLLNTVTNTYAVLKLTSILTNNVVNEARWSLQRNTFVGAPNGGFKNSQVGIADLVPGTDYIDGIGVTGIFTAGTGLTGASTSKKWLTDWEAADLVSWTHGKHTVRFGAEVERDRYNWIYEGLSVGAMNFTTFQDFLLGLPGCAPGTTQANCAASAAAGLTNGTLGSNISSSGTTANFNTPGGILHYFRIPFGDAYVQDDIKLNSRLTVNLGLRWEYDGLAYDKLGNAVNLWPGLVQTVPIPGTTPATGSLAGFVVPSNFNFSAWPAPPVGGVYQSNQKSFTANSTGLHNFAPRVGFAWSPLASNRLVLRGGAGYFYDRIGTSAYLGGITQSQPYSLSVFQQSAAANYFSSEAQPYPANLALGWFPRWVNINSATQTGTTSNLVQNSNDPYYTTPVVYEWNLFTQYEFASHWTFEMGYVGSRGIHQTGGPELNEAGLAGNPLGTNANYYPALAAGLITTNTAANASLRVPYLGFSPLGIQDESNDTDTKFHSLQATLRKQFSHGFQGQVAYSFSRGYSTIFTENDPNIPQYGPNTGYHPERIAINYLWNIPANYQGLLGKLANGWGLSGVTIIQDGTPLTINDTRGGTIYGFGPGSPVISTAQYAAGMGAVNAPSSGSTKQRLGGVNGGQGWFNKAAFGTIPVPAFASDGKALGYGNSSYGILLGPGQFNWDVSLTKTTKVGGIHEDATLQFRTEFFNAFNHAQFNNPSVVDVSKGTFGQITSASVNPRLIQFALKYSF